MNPPTNDPFSATAAAALEIVDDGPVRTLWLNRPAVHNALDEHLIAALTAALQDTRQDTAVRVVVLAGRGRSFCAGGDLNWMQRAARNSAEENLADARRLAALFQAVRSSPQPVIARVQGNALAGGTGLVAACDIAIADTTARFGVTEVRIGLVPGVISPYLVEAIGARAASRCFLTGERFAADEGHRLGLVHELCAPDQLDAALQRCIGELLAGGPAALAEAKALLRTVAGRPLDAALVETTAAWIARVRSTSEAEEGIGAFLAKRPPAWRA